MHLSSCQMSVGQPRVSFQGIFASVPVIVHQLLANADVPGCHQNEAGLVLYAYDASATVGRGAAVVDEATQSSRLWRGVNAASTGKEDVF